MKSYLIRILMKTLVIYAALFILSCIIFYLREYRSSICAVYCSQRTSDKYIGLG